MEILEKIVEHGAQIGIAFFEISALLVMVVNGVVSLLMYLRKRPHVVLFLTKAMNFALMFMLCGEILRMLYVRTFSEIGVVVCIVILHGVISYLIHWEIRKEEDHHSNMRAEPELEDINL